MEPRMMVSATAPLAVRPRTENTARDVHGVDVLGPPLGAAGEVQTVVGLEATPDRGGSTNSSTDPGSGSPSQPLGEDAGYAAFARAHRNDADAHQAGVTAGPHPSTFPWDRNRDGWVDDQAYLVDLQRAGQAAARQAAAAAAESEAARARIAAPVGSPTSSSTAAPTVSEPPPELPPLLGSEPVSVPGLGAGPSPAPARPEITVPGLDVALPPPVASESAEPRPDPVAHVTFEEPKARARPVESPRREVAPVSVEPAASPRPDPVVVRYSSPAPAVATVSNQYL